MSQGSAARAKLTSKPGRGTGVGRPGGLTSRVIDNDSYLLEQSYHLRYQVYCLERGFLPAENYPDQLEVDEFDANSIHVGVLNAQDDIVGTARLVKPGNAGFPLLHYCNLFEDALVAKNELPVHPIEASRLAIRREGNGGDIVLHIYKAFYQASKRGGFTHWLAATERSLQRLMSRYGFPWRAVGPEADYYGLVSPYLMSLREFDKVILSGRIPILSTFLDGLEPEFAPGRPVRTDVWDLVDRLR